MKIAKSILELCPTCGSLLHIDIAFDFLSTLIQCNDNHMVIAFARVLVRRCNQLDEIVLVFVSAQPTHFLLRKDEPKSPTCDEHDNEKHSRDMVNWIKRIKCARHVGVKLYAMHTFAFSLDAQQKAYSETHWKDPVHKSASPRLSPFFLSNSFILRPFGKSKKKINVC